MTDKEIEFAKNTKIYLIQNEKGEFINVEDTKDLYFTSKLHLGSYSSEKGLKGFEKNIEYLNKIGKYGKLKMFETTMYDHISAGSIEISTTIIGLDIVAKKIELARDMIPNVGQANKDCRKSLLNTSGKLKFVNPLFEGCVKNNDDFTFEKRAIYDAMINEVALYEMWELENLVEVLQGYRKNKKTVLGSARRVLKKEL